MGLPAWKQVEASGYIVKDRQNMYVVIGADIVPTKSNMGLFISGDSESLIGEELKDVLEGASYRIFNLEVPLTDEEIPIIKQGPNLIAPTTAVAGYKAIGVDLLTLANNHILDQDIQGLKNTIMTLEKESINHLGGGNNLKAASKPFIFNFANKKIGVYACAEHEFSIAGETTPGANPFDPLWSLDHVEELKEKTDYVIVLYHGGKEHYRYPSPMLQRTCRRLVDKGADLVICQHSHCIGCEEKYAGGVIIYGQGNFIFDDSDDECWQTSLLVKVDDDFNVIYLPLIKTGNGVRLAEKNDAEAILDDFLERSNQINKEGAVQKKYDEFARSCLTKYLNNMKGKETVIYKVANRLSQNKLREKTLKRKYDIRQLVALRNWIECEAHRELLIKGIQSKTEKEPNRK